MWPIVLTVVGLAAVTWTCWRTVTLAELADLANTVDVDAANTTAGDLSIVIPARDEAEVLPLLLADLAGCDPAAGELLVVDDSSHDATATLAAAAGARVLSAPPLPDGWAGKPWACTVGVTASSGSTLLFLDADTRLAPDALGRLVGAHAARGGLLSVQPSHHPGRVVEELSAVFNVVAVAGSGLFTATSSPTRGVAFGPCLLTSRTDYDAVGGHSASKASVIEDIALARAYVRDGRPVTTVLGGDIVTFRMYPQGFGALVRGWTKNIALGAGSAPALPTLAVVVWITALAAAAIDLVVELVAWSTGEPTSLVPFVLYVVLAAHLHALLRKVGRFRAATAILFPVPLVVFIAIFLRSLAATALGRNVVWRNRSIPTRPRGRS